MLQALWEIEVGSQAVFNGHLFTQECGTHDRVDYDRKSYVVSHPIPFDTPRLFRAINSSSNKLVSKYLGAVQHSADL